MTIANTEIISETCRYKISPTVLRIELGRPVTEEDIEKAERELENWQREAATRKLVEPLLSDDHAMVRSATAH